MSILLRTILCVLIAIGLSACNDGGEAGDNGSAGTGTLSNGPIGRLVGLINASDFRPVWTDFGFDKSSNEFTIMVEMQDERVPFAPEYFSDYESAALFAGGNPSLPSEVQRAYSMVDLNVFAGLHFIGSWAATALDTTPEELKSDFLALHKKYGGTTEERPVVPYLQAGQTYRFTYEGITATLYEVQSSTAGPADCRYSIERNADVAAGIVQERKAPFEPLKEFGTADNPLSLTGLLDLVAEQGAIGLIRNYDLSQMSSKASYRDLKAASRAEYDFTMVYSDSEDLDAEGSECHIFAANDGSVLALSCTGRWLASVNDMQPAELSAQYDELFATGAGKTITIDAAGSEFDMEFSWCRYAGINVVRKTYEQPFNDGAYECYFIITGMDYGATGEDSDFDDLVARQWPVADELPEATADPGPVEKLVRDLGRMPMSAFLSKYGCTELEDNAVATRMKPVATSTSEVFEAAADARGQENYFSVRISVIDRTFLAQVLAGEPAFANWLSVSQDDISAEFEKLAAGFPTEDETIENQYGPIRTRIVHYGPMSFVQSSVTKGTESRDDDQVTYYILPGEQDR